MIFNEIKKPVSLETTLSVAKGSAQGLGQALLANDGQPAKTVLAVGYTNTGKVQGVSLGDGNVVEVNGVAVSSINDFKATIPTADITAIKAKTDTLANTDISTLATKAKQDTMETTLNSLSNYDDTNLTNLINGLNDITAQDVWNVASRTITNTEFGLSTATINSIATEVESHLIDEADGQTIINAIVGAIGNTNINEVSLVASIRADLERANGNLNLIKTKTDTLINADLTGIATSANITAQTTELKGTSNRSLTDVYDNTPDVNLTPVLNAISALNDLSLLDVENSTILAKQATLNSIVNSIANIPTDSTTDLTPVLTAISNLNDITPADARSAFNEADFKDKNTELEIHNWLDSYTNKDNWKESATVDADVVATAVWDKVIE